MSGPNPYGGPSGPQGYPQHGGQPPQQPGYPQQGGYPPQQSYGQPPHGQMPGSGGPALGAGMSPRVLQALWAVARAGPARLHLGLSALGLGRR